MTSPLVLLAHAPSVGDRAAEVRALLASLGYEVGELPGSKRGRIAKIEAAHRLVLLWSRDAGRSPTLRAAAKQASAAGKLACVRLDAAIPPARICDSAQPLPQGRFAQQTWVRLLNRAETRTRVRSPSVHRTSRVAGLGAALTLGLVAATALYITDANFAARVDGFAGMAQAHAGELADTIKAQMARDS